MGQDGTDTGWPASWTTKIGSRLQRHRKMAGISALALSERCSKAGFPIPRSTIANLESGRKEAIPVHEVVILSEALRIPPLALLYGIDEHGETEILPDLTGSAWSACIRFADGLGPFAPADNAQRGEPRLTIKEALIHYSLTMANA